MKPDKITETRRGDLLLKVFRRLGDGKFVFAVDKFAGRRRLWGAMFPEEDARWLIGIADEQRGLESGMCLRSAVRREDVATPVSPSAREEIGAAIKSVHNKESPPDNSGVKVLPTMPEFRYPHTCPDCGCHVAACLRGLGSHRVKVCSYCDHVYAQP